jgi:hypothetical protein
MRSSDREKDVIGDGSDGMGLNTFDEVYLAGLGWVQPPSESDGSGAGDDEEQVVTGMRVWREASSRREADHVGAQVAVADEGIARGGRVRHRPAPRAGADTKCLCTGVKAVSWPLSTAESLRPSGKDEAPFGVGCSAGGWRDELLRERFQDGREAISRLAGRFGGVDSCGEAIESLAEAHTRRFTLNTHRATI